MVVTLELASALRGLSERRPVFHSEADFQHALAWELQKMYPDADVRLEVPLHSLKGRGALDIVCRLGRTVIALELKYLKGRLEHQQGDERFGLLATGARDIARHDVCKDVQRLEHAVGSGQADMGFAVILANDSAFWQDTGFDGIDTAFKVHHGRTLSGVLSWHARAGAGTTRKRDKPLELSGDYELRWWPYSRVNGTNGEFQVLVIPVTRGPASPAGKNSDDDTRPRRNSRVPGRYDPLRAVFAGCEETDVELTFEQIEALVGTLPPSALTYQAWWSTGKSHTHAVWSQYGFKAKPDFVGKRVNFRRSNRPKL
jgi:hypothetical protein